MTHFIHLFRAYFPHLPLYWQLAGLGLFALVFALCWAGDGAAARLRFARAFVSAALAGYVFLLLGMLVLARGTQAQPSVVLIPLRTWRKVLDRNAGSFEWACLALFNCLLFLPLGFLAAAERSLRRGPGGGPVRAAALCGFAVSLLMETLQLVLRRGTFELDDLLHNTLGAVLGALLWRGASALLARMQRRNAP